MYFPIMFDEVRSGWSIIYIQGSQVIYFLNLCLSLKIEFSLANGVDPDEMLYYAKFHLGLHCLPKYSLRGFSVGCGQNK